MQQAISVRYGRALASVVLRPSSGIDPEAISAELHAFGDNYRKVPELRNVLLSPAVAGTRKHTVIQRLADALPLSAVVRNFLFILVDRRRTQLIGQIADAFDAAIDEHLGIARAEVTSAVPLSDGEKADLESALSQVTGRQVRCKYSVDDSLIGGILTRIGSTVYDGSVRSQLEAMRQVLVS